MRRLAPLLLSLLVLAPAARGNGIQGTALRSNGQPAWPCNIEVFLRGTTTLVPVPADSTLPSGQYDLVLPDNRYDVVFNPPLGTHQYQTKLLDQRVQGNTITANVTILLGSYFKGRVVDVNGAGVPSTDLRFKDAAGNLASPVQDNGTNADGTFNALVPHGIWNAEIIPANADHKAPVLFPNVDMTTADILMGNVVVQQGWVLTCSVTDPSQFPVTNAKVVARSTPSRDKMFTPINTTNASGVATIVVPPGLYEITAEPPPTLMQTYATMSQYDLSVTADATLPNFALPPGHLLSAHGVGGTPSAPVPAANVNVDQFISPNFQRIETPGDITDVNGNFTVTVPSGAERFTLSPPVATKLIPFRIDNLVIGSSNVNLGTITFAPGHWVDVTVVDDTGVPIADANINLFNLNTGNRLITIDNTTLASGSTRIVTDDELYRVKVYPPSTAYDTAFVIGAFRTLQDTAVTIIMPRKGVLGVGPSPAGSLRFANPWPSPARGAVHFSFSGAGEGELDIVDVSGRRVATPWRGTLGQDRTASWPGRDETARPVANGIYFAVLRAGGERNVHRIVIAN